MPVLRNIGFLARCLDEGRQGEIQELRNAALVWEQGEFVWIGEDNDLPEEHNKKDTWDAAGRLVVPGLIDCHTHLAFGGWRADEFRRKLEGEDYQSIAASGGGIRKTVEQTRRSTQEQLVEKCRFFLDEMSALGVTTVECKSGYGLNGPDELKQLRVYSHLQRTHKVRLVPTFLAHMIPDEYNHKRAAYGVSLGSTVLPLINSERLARFVDIFIDDHAFNNDEAEYIAKHAAKNGLKLKLHVDQFKDDGGGALAAKLGATSADHLEHVSDEGIQKMAEAGTVAVSLSMSEFFLDQPPMPARKFIDAGVPLAIATDFNPGSAPSYHLPLAMLLACRRQGITPQEALKAVTLNAAKALALGGEIGSIEEGKSADFVVIDSPDVDHWIYQFRANPALMTVGRGELLYHQE